MFNVYVRVWYLKIQVRTHVDGSLITYELSKKSFDRQIFSEKILVQKNNVVDSVCKKTKRLIHWK